MSFDQPPAPYDGFAATFAAEAAVSAYNAFYDRPTVLDLIGDVRGSRVLDAGCGPGLYLAELNARGARTIGVDQSADMIARARERLGPAADLRQHDLDEPLDWLGDGSVDLVLLGLVLHYLRDRTAVMRDLHRILAPHGRIVISTSHPTADWLADGGSYFDARHVQQQWSGGMVHRFWRQPLTAWCAEFTAAGFVIEQLIEHQPDPAMADHHPNEHTTLSREPGFIAFRLAKAPAAASTCPAPRPTDPAMREVPQCTVTSSPTLIVVSGPPGSDKTTLARRISAQIGCPLIIRDEIKQGLVMATPGYEPSGDDPLNLTALAAFTDVLTTLLKAGTTTVAEAAFQDRLWRPILEGLTALADIRIIRCEVPTETAHHRVADRATTDTHRAAHGDSGLLEAIASGNSPIASFTPIAMDLPTLIVDTSDDYKPGLPDIIAFATGKA